MTEEFHVAALCWYSYVPFSLKHPLACFEKYHTLKICKKNCHEDKRVYFLKRIYEIPPFWLLWACMIIPAGNRQTEATWNPKDNLHTFEKEPRLFQGDFKGKMIAFAPLPLLFYLLLLLSLPPDAWSSTCPAAPTHTVGNRNYYLKVMRYISKY